MERSYNPRKCDVEKYVKKSNVSLIIINMKSGFVILQVFLFFEGIYSSIRRIMLNSMIVGVLSCKCFKQITMYSESQLF